MIKQIHKSNSANCSKSEPKSSRTFTTGVKLLKNKVLFRKDVMKENPDGTLRVVGSKCNKCGRTYLPPEPVCPRDFSEDMSEIAVPQYGTLYSYTVLYRAMPPFPFPHALGEVEFDNCMLVKGILDITDPEKLEKGKEFMIGSKMETIVTTIYEDEENEYYTWMWNPVD